MDFLDLTKFKTCPCGTTVESPTHLHVQYKYSWIGWFFWSMGTTAIPTAVIFNCTKCQNIFEHLKDRELIKYYIFYRKN